MVEKNRVKTTNGVLLAKVNERLNVREDGQLDVWLRVEAENRTSKTLVLDENYHIPMDEAFDVVAYDLNSKQRLTAFHGNGRIEIAFKPGTCLPAGQKFIWLVKYKTTRFGVIKEKEHELVTAVFTLAPRLSYKEIPIQNHRFQLSVAFERPRQGELFRELSVSQSNNHNVPVDIKEKQDRVVCVFKPFDLGKGSTLRATFVYKYRSSNLRIADTGRANSGLVSYFRGPFIAAMSQQVPVIVTSLIKELLNFLFRR